MAKYKSEKTISANSRGIVISYGDVNKHQFVGYDRSYGNKVQTNHKRYQPEFVEPYQFSPKQKDLFQKVVLGFKAYTKEEIDQMSEKKKIFVSVTYTKAQRILRNWKQDVVFTKLDDMLLAVFPNSPLVRQFVNVKGHVDVPKEDEISFDDLGINREQVANKLMEYGLLPKNFYQLV